MRLANKLHVGSRIFSMSWDEYYRSIQKDEIHTFKGRIELLNTAQSYFKHRNHFCSMEEIQRRELAGVASLKQSCSHIDWGWFGSMKGSGKFQNRINENDTYISQALDAIPMQGHVCKADYKGYVDLFKQAFPDGGAGVAITSRLLAMKRPDCFVCLDKPNLSKLCDAIGVSKSVSVETYWDKIVERIHESVWYSSEMPKNDIESSAWRGRVAMIDAIFLEAP